MMSIIWHSHFSRIRREIENSLVGTVTNGKSLSNCLFVRFLFDSSLKLLFMYALLLYVLWRMSYSADTDRRTDRWTNKQTVCQLNGSEWEPGNYAFGKFRKTADKSFGHFLAILYYLECPHNDRNWYTHRPGAILSICCKLLSFCYLKN